ncbi:MAG: transposase [Blastocatellales bacterium]|nr:transposase [Blastocatellales bacterium]
MRKAYRYRLYPTKQQAEFLDGQLAEACRLYNAAVQERRDAYGISGRSLNYYDQANQLKEIRAAGDLRLENFSCCQDVLRRWTKPSRRSSRRVNQGVKAGFPRFKPRARFDSITFPSYGDGCRLLDNGKLRIQGAGHIKVKLHRPVTGTIKTVTLKREAGKWYVCFSVECQAELLAPCAETVGLDVGAVGLRHAFGRNRD